AAAAGKLGTVPPAVATFAKTAMAQHKDHAAAWNSVLTAAGKPAVTATDPALTPTVQSKFAQVKDVTGLAQLALLIENVAAQTYQNGVAILSSSKAVAVAATIQPVEMQHAAILYYALGQYPGIQGDSGNSYATGSPLAFNPTTLARPASDYTGN
ncbi:MAG TPA: ferritin-like domain-containing protein, partial [Acidimicrobiales bacterium]|nr:ferritin-like domain-containing protein [Acidimicrobiales bacterium]